MIRTAGLSALGLVLNACPFGAPEKPDGYATVTGHVQVLTGPNYAGRVWVQCFRADHSEPSFGNSARVDAQANYRIELEAPYGSFRRQVAALQFECKAQAGPAGGPFAIRQATVPFSETRANRPETRIDLRQGEM
ncbi:hypothetical protein [Longimicrobium sp.]|jgi:hypothetical protein|uniref:hypothetical protein n=1 Tax=Longimicrobium sp. TaxID=2029185 RepID=UPI002F94E4A9